MMRMEIKINNWFVSNVFDSNSNMHNKRAIRKLYKFREILAIVRFYVQLCLPTGVQKAYVIFMRNWNSLTDHAAYESET